MSFKTIASILICSVILSSCVTNNTSGIDQDFASNDIGAASGREIIRAFDGGILPAQSFNQLSRTDRTRALLAEYRALENMKTGQTVVWQNPKGRASGSVTPAQPFSVGSQNCRQYRHEAVIKGQQVEASGTACRTPSGKWIPLK